MSKQEKELKATIKLVKEIAKKNHFATKKAFNEIISEKVGAAIENMHIELAEGWDDTERKIQKLEKQIATFNDGNDATGEKMQKAQKRLKALKAQLQNESTDNDEEGPEESQKEI